MENMRIIKVKQKNLKNQSPISNNIEVKIGHEGDTYIFYKNGQRLLTVLIGCYTDCVDVHTVENIDTTIFKNGESVKVKEA